MDTSSLSKDILGFSQSVRNKLVKLFKLEREFRKLEAKKTEEQLQSNNFIRINIQQYPDLKKSQNTVNSDQTNSLFPVIEESEYNDFDVS